MVACGGVWVIGWTMRPMAQVGFSKPEGYGWAMCNDFPMAKQLSAAGESMNFTVALKCVSIAYDRKSLGTKYLIGSRTNDKFFLSLEDFSTSKVLI